MAMTIEQFLGGVAVVMLVVINPSAAEPVLAQAPSGTGRPSVVGVAAEPNGNKDQPGGIIELRTPVPKAADQERAAKLLHDVFKDDFAQAKQPAARLELAEKLIKQSQDASDDVVSSYVLLHEAADLAIDAHDAKATERFISMISASFIINPLEELSTALDRIASKAHPPAINKDIASVALGRIDDALRLDQPEVAQRLADTALATARKAKDAAVLKQAIEVGKHVTTVTQQSQAKAKAELTLKENPDDPAANLVLGKYLCFVKNEWDAGLKHLVNGNDEDLKTLATESIAVAPEPTALVGLADRWWAAAEKNKAKEKADLRAGAAHYYSAALPNLTGLSKARVEKLLAQVEPAHIVRPSRPTPAPSSAPLTAPAKAGVDRR